MIACENTDCPWWDEDGCLSEECGEWEEGEYMNRPEEPEGHCSFQKPEMTTARKVPRGGPE